jgi:hypothetical protein
VTAANAKAKYDRAIAGITRLEKIKTEAAARIAEVRQAEHLTDDAKRQHINDIRNPALAAYREGRGEIETLLTDADSTAHSVLGGDPNDTALESRKARAAIRVARLIDGGTPVISAAEVFAEAGDLDALRALRDEIPSAIAAVPAADRLGNHVRTQQVREITLSVDRMMAPLLPGVEGQVARMRDNIDTALGWVKALGEDTVKTLSDQHYTRIDQSAFYRDMLVEV